MKKLLLLLTATMLLSGCITSVHDLSSGEMMTPQYAYVAGVADTSLDFIHSNYVSDKLFPTAPAEARFNFMTNDGQIVKVTPGVYVIEYRDGTATAFGGKVRLGSLMIAAGRINYIGSILLNKERKSFTASGATYSIKPEVSYQTEAVKAKLKQNYPRLAQDIDSKFVVQPLR